MRTCVVPALDPDAGELRVGPGGAGARGAAPKRLLIVPLISQGLGPAGFHFEGHTVHGSALCNVFSSHEKDPKGSGKVIACLVIDLWLLMVF